jgi:iron(III) transport system substrate-binding protein
MLGEKAQALYANGNYEFPVNTAVTDSAAVKLLGTVTPDKLPLSEVAKQRKPAANLVDKVGFDN